MRNKKWLTEALLKSRNMQSTSFLASRATAGSYIVLHCRTTDKLTLLANCSLLKEMHAHLKIQMKASSQRKYPVCHGLTYVVFLSLPASSRSQFSFSYQLLKFILSGKRGKSMPINVILSFEQTADETCSYQTWPGCFPNGERWEKWLYWSHYCCFAHHKNSQLVLWLQTHSSFWLEYVIF